MRVGRRSFAACALPTGQVFCAGGFGGAPPTALPTGAVDVSRNPKPQLRGRLRSVADRAQISPLVSKTNKNSMKRCAMTSIVLTNSAECAASRSAELYDPATGIWELQPDMDVERDGCAGCALADGRICVVGGCGDGEYQRTAVAFDLARLVTS
eukprot:SAG31_NODE_2114_length_6416_cov_25.024379_1_plen_154_part_00